MTTERIKRRIERLLDQLEEPQALRIGRRSRGCRGRWWPSIGRMPTPWRSWRWPAICADVVGHLTSRSLRPSSSTIPKTDRMYSSNEHFAARFLKSSARNSSCPIIQTITDNIRLVSACELVWIPDSQQSLCLLRAPKKQIDAVGASGSTDGR